jgi:hypothetical protein
VGERKTGLPLDGEEPYTLRMMEPLSPGRLDKLDGLNPTRALILQAYYGQRRMSAPSQIGTRQIAMWIKDHEPHEPLPSAALIQLTLMQAKVPHRAPGRPRRDGAASAPPFLSTPRPAPRASEARSGRWSGRRSSRSRSPGSRAS